MKLSKSQMKALDLVKSGENIFLTGKAGTGKSFLTKEIITYFLSIGKKVLVCAPTGIAAFNIDGVTLHSAFRAGTSILEPYSFFRGSPKQEIAMKNLAAIEVIIIDEISMCRCDLFEYVLNTCKRLISKGAAQKQLILVGDFYQLPPVLIDDDKEAYDYLYHGNLYAFQSPLWNESNIRTVELTEAFRQTDKDLLRALDNIREGRPDFNIFQGVLNKPIEPQSIRICATNKEANKVNSQGLAKLKGKSMTYDAECTGKFEPNPTDLHLKLVVGARVMVLVNKTGEYVNGQLGCVEDVFDNRVRVCLDNGKHIDVEANEWAKYRTEIVCSDSKTKEKKVRQVLVASFKQIPLKLAWAITVHKSQGQTFEKATIFVDNFFSSGQMYVALSRCKSLEGMNLIGNLSKDKLLADPTVLDFMKGTPNSRIEIGNLPVTKSTKETKTSHGKINSERSSNKGSSSVTNSNVKDENSYGHGGKRINAGRKSNWGVPTQVMRIPQILRDDVLRYISRRMKAMRQG